MPSMGGGRRMPLERDFGGVGVPLDTFLGTRGHTDRMGVDPNR
jgi:hypothetical protein